MSEPAAEPSEIAEQVNRAIDLASDGKLAEAVPVLEALVQKYPEQAGVQAYVAWFLSEAGRLDEAVVHSELAVGLAPEIEKVSMTHFYALNNSGRVEDAVAEMRRFLAIKPCKRYSQLLEEWEQQQAEQGPQTDSPEADEK